MPFPSPGDLPNSRFEPASPALTGGFFTAEPPGKPVKSPGILVIGILRAQEVPVLHRVEVRGPALSWEEQSLQARPLSSSRDGGGGRGGSGSLPHGGRVGASGERGRVTAHLRLSFLDSLVL